jgi:hypothetical protein
MNTALARAKQLAETATAESADILKKGRAAMRTLREEGKRSVLGANRMSLVEAPAGGFVAGVVDSVVKPIGGMVPWSIPLALLTGAVGWFTGQGDVIRIASGMAAGVAYRLGGGLVDTVKAIAALGKGK